MPTVTIEKLLERNKATSARHTPIPTLEDLAKAGSPGPKTMIVTCLDPRCVPEKFFDLDILEVLVHRNAGGNIRHALRDIIILDGVFKLDELAIVHHTDCGTLHFTEEGLHADLKATVDKAYHAEIDAMVFGANTNIEESVRGDLEWVRASPFIRDHLKHGTQGFVFDIKTGKVDKVDY
ncbi:carbonic anhydrase [Apodospora peruviana]|uniref:Carbonic anhydrase n=1 Tax=Apodospora peruviana TaxID=516989 RepID=A0AAE0I5R7_9PEZI|nr:carbonic anhydrase [Apodospora peruviana]